MADDYPNNSTTNGVLPIGGTANGSLESSNDTDWFAVSVLAGYTYQFDLSATPGFTNPASINEYLINASGTKLAGGTASYNAVKTFDYQPITSGTDYIAVTSNTSNSIGNYVLTSSHADDYPSNSTTPAVLAAGSSLSATLESTDDSDWIAVAVRAGYNTQFTLTAAVGMTNPAQIDEYLINVNGTGLAGGTASYNSTKSFNYVPTATGTDYLIVRSASGTSVGGYSVTESSADDYVANSSTTGRLMVGSGTTGKLEGAGDTDWFAVTLSAGSTYQFNLAATTGFSNPAGLDLTLLSVNGASVAGNAYSADKTISYTPATSGTYYLAVSSYNGDGIGTYTLSSPTPPTPSVPVYRFFDTNSGTQFLTSSGPESNTVMSTRPDLTYEGVGLKATATNDPNASAVYRFFDKVYGTHFFTSSGNERDTIIATRADLTYEGVGFYEYANQQSGSSAVYRFFDTHAGTHFYTGSESERATILATRSDLTPEGVAFYAPT